MSSTTSTVCMGKKEEIQMNHDYAHCIDYNNDCPKDCKRAQLTEEALEQNYTIVDWSHCKGTDGCKLERREDEVYD